MHLEMSWIKRLIGEQCCQEQSKPNDTEAQPHPSSPRVSADQGCHELRPQKWRQNNGGRPNVDFLGMLMIEPIDFSSLVPRQVMGVEPTRRP